MEGTGWGGCGRGCEGVPPVGTGRPWVRGWDTGAGAEQGVSHRSTPPKPSGRRGTQVEGGCARCPEVAGEGRLWNEDVGSRVRETLDRRRSHLREGHGGVTATSPQTAAGVCARAPVLQRGTEQGPRGPGLGPTRGAGFWRLHWPLGGHPGLLVPSELPSASQSGWGRAFPGRWRRGGHAAPGLCLSGRKLAGDPAEPEAASTLGLWGQDSGGGGLSWVWPPRSPGPPPRPPLPPRPVEEGWCFPRGHPGLWAPSALLCWQTQEN